MDKDRSQTINFYLSSYKNILKLLKGYFNFFKKLHNHDGAKEDIINESGIMKHLWRKDDRWECNINMKKNVNSQKYT